MAAVALASAASESAVLRLLDAMRPFEGLRSLGDAEHVIDAPEGSIEAFVDAVK